MTMDGVSHLVDHTSLLHALQLLGLGPNGSYIQCTTEPHAVYVLELRKHV